MKIVEERTRLIFTEYTDLEKRLIEDIVATDDKAFTYEDPDNHIIAFPPGMKPQVVKAFPKIPIIDHTKIYWEFDRIGNIEHEMKPRNQLQIDCIEFILGCAKNKEKVAAIVSPGTGKAVPNNTKIPTPDGYKLMGDIKVGDKVIGRNGKPTTVIGVYPQGCIGVYRITFEDGREAYCCKDHLWNVIDIFGRQKTISMKEIIDNWKEKDYHIPYMSNIVDYNSKPLGLDPYMYGKMKKSNRGIDEKYLYNSFTNRFRLLNGICDSYNKDLVNAKRITISNKENMKFMEDLYQLILGLNYPVEEFNGESITFLTDKTKRPNGMKIVNVRKMRKDQECTCIKVDASDSLFLTENFIVTHNTFMACYCAIRVGAKTLMIAPTSGIKQQWADTLTDMFNVDPSKVKLVSKPQDFINTKYDFVVVSQASLAVLNKTYNLEKIMKNNRFGIKIIDEVQMWWHNMIKIDGNSNICHNWYLTGTFGRSGEDENAIYQQMYGDLKMFKEKDKRPTLFNRKPGNIYGMKPHMHVKMIWTKSGLSDEEISSIMGSMRYSERAGRWIRYGISVAKHSELVIPSDGTLTKFLSTILKVIKQAEKEVTYGKTLVLGSTINAAEVVAAYLRKMFPDKKIYTYHSRNTAQMNAEAKEEADIMVSTISSAGTGFDWKGLGKLVVFAQYKSWILTDQISGRLRRRDDEKDTYMWDIVDAQVGQLRAWANARADVEKRKAKTFKVVDM